MTNFIETLDGLVNAQLRVRPVNGDKPRLVDLGNLRRALLAALEDTDAAIRAKLPEYVADGYSQQRMAELAGMSIQTIRKAVVPGAAEKDRAAYDRVRKAGREALGPRPESRGRDTSVRMRRGARDADAFSGPTRVVVTDDASEAFAGRGVTFDS